MEAHRHGVEKEEEQENLTSAWKQKPRHGEAVPARPQQLRVQGRRRRYADEPNHQHNTLGTMAQAMAQHHPCQISLRHTRASTTVTTARRRDQIVGGDSSPDPTWWRSGERGSSRRIHADQSIDHHVAVRT
jgi:hypothetical protein